MRKIFCDFTELPEDSGSWNKGMCYLHDEALVRAFMDAWLNNKTVTVVANNHSASPFMEIQAIS